MSLSAEAATLAGQTATPGRALVRRPARRKSALVGAALLLTFIFAAVLAPWIAPYGVNEQAGPIFGHPSLRHPLGLDDAGHDMLTLTMWSARTSLLVGFAAALVSMIIGGGIGLLSGYVGGRTDMVLMRVTDYALVIPDVPLMIVVAATWGPSLTSIILIIGFLVWPVTARVVRSQVKATREQLFVRRAEAFGAGHLRVIGHHVLPHIGSILVATSLLTVATAIFAETALSFLGLGDPTRISWGKMIENAFLRSAFTVGAWWAIVPPGVCVALVVLSASLISRSLEDALNPRLATTWLGRPRRQARGLQ